MITIADDNVDILESTQLLLEVNGHEATTTAEAGQIHALLKERRPVLHLQDMQMPELQLHALLETLRRDPDTNHIPIVLFTAGSPQADEWAAMGADGCLHKPFDLQRLESLVDAAARGGRAAVRTLMEPPASTHETAAAVHLPPWDNLVDRATT